MAKFFLVGMMGSGKTVTAKALAEKLKIEWVDLDEQIESACGKKITEIFATEGEESFRDKETEALQKVASTKSDAVVSTGGGIILRSQNIEIMKSQGMVIYLRATLETIYERVRDDKNRPLLKTEDPKKKIEELLHMRSFLYEKIAELTVDTDQKTAEQTAMDMLGKLS